MNLISNISNKSLDEINNISGEVNSLKYITQLLQQEFGNFKLDNSMNEGNINHHILRNQTQVVPAIVD